MDYRRAYTRSERHAMLVRREKRNKQKNVCLFWRNIRADVLRTLRMDGRKRRDNRHRLIAKLEHAYGSHNKHGRTHEERDKIMNEPVIM